MKLFGLILLCAIPVFLGFWQKKKQLSEGRIKRALIDFFSFTSFEIGSFLRPQEEIFCSFENKDLEEVGFLPLLRSQVKSDPCFALARSLESFSSSFPFSAREKKALMEFGENFGMQSKEKQMEDLQNLLSVLKSVEETERETRQAKATLSQTLGWCIGAGIFILLI